MDADRHRGGHSSTLELLTFSRILVPLDGTPDSNAALPAARTMAQATGAAIVLLRVLESPGSQGPAHAVERLLTRVADELAKNGLQVESAVHRGRPTDVILQQVNERRIDLVVMRTRARAGLERAVMGSVAESLLSRTDIPIVMLRPGGLRLDRLANLLVPVDGSPGGALALASGVGLAKATGARIHLVEVVVPLAAHALSPGEYDPRWDDQALSAAETYVDGMAARLRAAGVVADGNARMASEIPPGIVDAADKHDCDLIVMSTNALTGLQRAVLGSVADAVVRTAPCPVLLVRRQ